MREIYEGDTSISGRYIYREIYAGDICGRYMREIYAGDI